MKLKDLETHLRAHGCILSRQGGNHTIYKNHNNNKITSVPRHREIKPFTVKSICKQLEIPLP